MTAKIVQDEIQRHKVKRELLSTRHAVEEDSTSFSTELTIAEKTEELLSAASLSLCPYITSTTSCTETLHWFIR